MNNKTLSNNEKVRVLRYIQLSLQYQKTADATQKAVLISEMREIETALAMDHDQIIQIGQKILEV